MDYEEKYKQALEIAKEVYHDHRKDRYWRDWLTKLFPELKENKDERIRKGLITAVSGILKGNNLYRTDVTREEALAWLEKQGEQKHFSDFKAKDWYVSKVDGKIYNMTYNPADKVEPKFKVGDKVTMKGDNTVYTIGIIAPDKTCWLKHGSHEYGWATFSVLKHYVE